MRHTLCFFQHWEERLCHCENSPDVDLVFFPGLLQIDIHQRHVVSVAGIISDTMSAQKIHWGSRPILIR